MYRVVQKGIHFRNPFNPEDKPDTFANNVDPDRTTRHELSNHGLHYMPFKIVIFD